MITNVGSEQGAFPDESNWGGGCLVVVKLKPNAPVGG